ncbi:ParD-like family protein [Microbulbifer litoralis]|uniref:ParD-like family protein n=1 Tax=Microbulbifer litoralis TaxID=2933965 RepID=UPI00202915D2|nr:ParD-like family protein [Microbulbifer sp. GX H0434]
MGIVKISDELHDEIRRASSAMARSINAQAEFWIRLGMLAEMNPDQGYDQLRKQLLRAEPPTLEELIRE